MSLSFGYSARKRRIAWLLLASFLFQALLPVLAQAASSQSNEGQLPFCTMQGAKFLTLAGDTGEAPEIASSTQLCPACLLYHLAQVSLPVTEGLLSLARFGKDSWFPRENTRAQDIARISHTAIRAPPHA